MHTRAKTDPTQAMFPPHIERILRMPAGANTAARTILVPVKDLVVADSPRLAGKDAEHVELLAASGTTLPPILVHRDTMRVIDGMHRLGAALLRGQDLIEAVFFDGPEEHTFLLAVAANISHGLPLSSADRQAAAARILTSYSAWSDRAVARASGLSPGTVATIRSRLALHDDTARIGSDGRLRPLNTEGRRRRAEQVIAERPTASLREIAKAAGISPATARDVRLRVQRGDGRVPSDELTSKQSEAGSGTSSRLQNLEFALRRLRADPSLRLTETGRSFLRWFLPRAVGPRGWEPIAIGIAPHAKYQIARLARDCAAEWQRFADQMEQQAESIVDDSVA
jgi:ParB-like chromosome segregation protein Spo0J